MLISIGICFYIYSPILFFFLIPEPHLVGIHIDELKGTILDEKEQKVVRLLSEHSLLSSDHVILPS